MKYAFLFGLSFIIDLGSSHSWFSIPEKISARKRVTRQSPNIVSKEELLHFKTRILSECIAYGGAEKALILQEMYDKMLTCIADQKMFVIPKDEFISDIVKCCQNAMDATTECLAAHKRNFPEFLLDIFKLVISFMYDNDHYTNNELRVCSLELNTDSAQRRYMQCVANTSEMHEPSIIPTSKNEFCKKYLPVSICFAEMLKDNCNGSPGLEKFMTDYVNVFKIPCEKKIS